MHRLKRWSILGAYAAVSVGVLGCVLLYLHVPAERTAAPRTPDPEREPQFSSRLDFHFAQSILWGELDKGSFPPLDDPRYVPSREAEWFLRDDDAVLLAREESRLLVFPEYIMATHHVVNDRLGNEPVAVTTCELSGSCALYSRLVGGQVLTFGLTGLLYGGNSILYDRETETQWLQLNGVALRGRLRGSRLRPAGALERARWSDVKDEPGVLVLAPVREVAFYRKFYEGIREERFGFKVAASRGAPDRRLDPYAEGVGITVQGESCFYAAGRVEREGLLNDTLGGWALVVAWDASRGECRLYRRWLDGRRLTFRGQEGELQDEETGSRWNLDGECVAGELAGRRLEVPFHSRVYWFAWSAVHPGTALP